MQLVPTINVMTPLGPGLAHFLEDGRSGVEWQVFIKRTGESWWFRNIHVRLHPDTTEAIGPLSPFTHIDPQLMEQIERYRAAGWLDPEKAAVQP